MGLKHFYSILTFTSFWRKKWSFTLEMLSKYNIRQIFKRKDNIKILRIKHRTYITKLDEHLAYGKDSCGLVKNLTWKI